MTVAMMSRITLHLKKQGRLQDVIDWDNGAVFSVRSGIASTVQYTRNALRFAHGSQTTDGSHRSHPASHSTQVTVTIDELITRDRMERGENGLMETSEDSETSGAPSLKDHGEQKHLKLHIMQSICEKGA